MAERVKARIEASGKWKRPITTSIEPAATWYSAEAYHQDYLRKHPGRVQLPLHAGLGGPGRSTSSRF